jgi:hypothetical protein
MVRPVFVKNYKIKPNQSQWHRLGESIIKKTYASENLPPAFAEAPARRTRLWQAGLRAGRSPLFAKEG